MLSKRSQLERLAIAETLVSQVCEEVLNNNVKGNILQTAVNIQVDINRIVWYLNRRRNEKVH